MKTKTCTSCKQELEITLFKFYDKYQTARVCNICKDPDQFGYKYCPDCGEKKPVSRYNRRKDSSNRKYQTRCRDCVSQYQREFRAKNRYNSSFEELEALKAAQEYKCLICSSEKKLVIDHNHETGQVRAILCDKCNRGLGYFNDDPVLLIAASNYLLEKGYTG